MSYSKLSETWLCGNQINLLENYNNSKKLMYIHIPKTGGSLIESLFIDYKVGREFKNWSSLECINKNASWWHILPSNFRKLDFSKLNVFTSIRDPIQKILSEFIWQQNIGMISKDKEINKWVIESLKSHTEANNFQDNHFEPQIKYIKDYHGNTIPYNNIIICDKYNYHKNINNFAIRNKLKIISFDQAIRNMEKFHSNITDYDFLYKQLKPGTIQLIKNYYKDDFILLENVKRHYKEKSWLN
mgnify:CR=1 FL=1